MNRADLQRISSLRRLQQDLADLSPNDRPALVPVGVALEQLLSGLPEDAAEPRLRPLLSLALEGLQAAYEASVMDTQALIDAIIGAASAVEDALASASEPLTALRIAEAGRTLWAALERDLVDCPFPIADESAGPVPVADESAGPSPDAGDAGSDIPTLDDLASLLLLVGPADIAGLTRLSAGLARAGAAETLPEQARSALEHAAERVAGAARPGTTDPGDALEEAGRHLEAAMAAVDAGPGDGGLSSGARDLFSEAGPISPDAEGPGDFLPAPQPAGSRPNLLPADADPGLLREFLTECRELVEGAEAALLAIETDPEDMEAINTVFRAFHTIKGTSAFLGIVPMSDLAHRAETVLSRIRDHEIRCAGGYADLALRSADALGDLIEAVQAALDGDAPEVPDGLDDLMEILADPEAAGVSDRTEPVDEPASGNPSGPPVESARQGSPIPAGPPRLGDILVAEGKVDRSQIERIIAEHGTQNLGESLVKAGAVSARDVASALRKQQRMRTSDRPEDSSVRVRTDRLDKLIEMVGELVIAQSMVAQDPRVVSGAHHDLSRKVGHAGKIVRELQDLSMSMRMVPLKATFQKMARLVRDLAQKCGKSIQFATDGDDTEIDRNMVDIINDPLVHMIRNAVDHGIEPPDEREALSKARSGTVRLRAYHSGGNVIVEIQDDGRGLDRDRIAAAAVARGLIESDKGLSDSEVFNLIFAPGFSTVEQVTAVSGRGVGMDVVRRNIESARGRIDISSSPGNGATFMLRLPLTLAITDGMLVRIGDERFIVPTVSIHLCFRPEEAALSTVQGRGELVMLRGELMPVFRLHRLFRVAGAAEDPRQGLLVVVGGEGRRCALLVDELLGQQQVVAKALGDGIGKVQGVSGGAILGDGRVGLILDTEEVLSLARQMPCGSGAPEPAFSAAA